MEASYEILYANDQYVCVRNYGTVTYENLDEYYETITLLDLYKTGMGNGALSVGEGDYWLDSRGIKLFDKDSMQIRQAILNFFEEKQYIYRTYIKEGRIGFLIPCDKIGEPYLKLEVSYDWGLSEERKYMEEALCRQINAE